MEPHSPPAWAVAHAGLRKLELRGCVVTWQPTMIIDVW